MPNTISSPSRAPSWPERSLVPSRYASTTRAFAAFTVTCLLLISSCARTSSGPPGDASNATQDVAVSPADTSIRADTLFAADTGARTDSNSSPACRCAAGQVCAAGFCVPTPSDQICGTNPFGDDMCGASAVCMSDIIVDGTKQTNRKCYAFPACGTDGSCPIGSHGAVCNVVSDARIFPDKGPVCLATLCLSPANCPSGQRCVRGPVSSFGRCTDGSPDSYCTDPSHCMSGICRQLGAGNVGTCM